MILQFKEFDKNTIMKYTITIFIIAISTLMLKAQVGIGTTSPRNATVLDIVSTTKGVLFPKVQLQALNVKTPLEGEIPNGTLVFNTGSSGTGANKVFPGFYEWYNGQWKLPISYETNYKVAKFNNNPSDQLTNWNPVTTAAPYLVTLFDTTEFNDDSDLFQKIGNTSLRINEVGTYVITTNIGFQLFPTNTVNSTIEIYFNYALDGTIASSKVLSRVPQQDGASVNGRFFYNLIDYVTVTSPGQILTLEAWRNNNYPTNQYIRYDEGVTSSLTIQKLR